MKVVFLYSSIAKFGGVERIFVDKLNYFSTIYKWEATLITFEQGNHPLSYHLSENVKHIDLDCRFFTLYKYSLPIRILKRAILSMKFNKKFNDIINKLEPNIVSCAAIDLPSLRAINNCKHKCIKIVESHGYTNTDIDKDINQNIRLRYRILLHQIRKEVKNMDIIICLTQRDADCWKNIKRNAIIPNIVTSYPENIEYNTDSKHAIAVGRLSEEKGYNILIDIWKIIIERGKEWILDFYGDGEEKENIIKKINEYGLNQHIIIHSPVSNIYEKYQESGLFAMTSRHEGFGLALVEAMSCGLPAVAFDCPCGPSDIMGEGNEYLVPLNDIETFADKICDLIDNPQKRIEQSNRNRLLSARYKRENIMPMWKELYEKELSRKLLT